MAYDSPHYVRYAERLTPDAPPVDVEIPQSRDDAFDLLRTIHRLATEDAAAWKAAVRQYTAVDWYMLALFMSGTQRLDPFTGRPEVDCEFQWNYAREHQFDGDRVLDKSSRGIWKSTWRCYVGITNVVINDPNEVIAIAAHEKTAAGRHGNRTTNEWLTNAELNAAWDDVFCGPDKTAWPLFSQEHGCTVKRTLSAVLPTLSWHSILSAPTGSRVGLFVIDDVESEATVESKEMREKTLQRFTSFLQTAGRVPRVWLNATHHHAAGLVTSLEKSGAFRVRCHAIEDVTKPAPDIAALYDECKGVLPLRDELGRHEELSPALRDIRLDGEPVFFHPLEVAQKRLDAMSTPGGLANFYMQCFGDYRAGQERRLQREWIRYYPGDPIEWARGANLYIVIDPSKGIGDPTFARVEACKADKCIYWVGGLRRKYTPSEFCRAVFMLAMEWVDIGTLMQIRVEEFGQSTWGYNLRTYFNSLNKHICPIISCGSHNTLNRESSGRQREWNGLEPLYRMGKRVFPEAGIWVLDDTTQQQVNLVKFYVDKEYGEFPLPPTDDGLAADYLLTVTKGKLEDQKEVPLALEFPETEFETNVRVRGSRWPNAQAGGDDAWMLEGLG